MMTSARQEKLPAVVKQKRVPVAKAHELLKVGQAAGTRRSISAETMGHQGLSSAVLRSSRPPEKANLVKARDAKPQVLASFPQGVTAENVKDPKTAGPPKARQRGGCHIS